MKLLSHKQQLVKIHTIKYPNTFHIHALEKRSADNKVRTLYIQNLLKFVLFMSLYLFVYLHLCITYIHKHTHRQKNKDNIGTMSLLNDNTPILNSNLKMLCKCFKSVYVHVQDHNNNNEIVYTLVHIHTYNILLNCPETCIETCNLKIVRDRCLFGYISCNLENIYTRIEMDLF